MTLDDVKKLDKDFLTAKDIQHIIQCDPNIIRLQAHKDQSKLGFPVIVANSRVKIPRIPFIQYVEGINQRL